MTEQQRALGRLEQMVRIRRVQSFGDVLPGGNWTGGSFESCIGGEAVAVGFGEALGPADAVVAAYREQGHALARGLSVQAVLAGRYGSALPGGGNGSLELFDRALRFYGGSNLCAGGLSVAVGLAVADRMQRLHTVTACFFGEMEASRPTFRSALEQAIRWELPMLFVCESNLPSTDSLPARSVRQRASALGMRTNQADGADVEACAETARAAVRSVRDAGGPVLIEVRTHGSQYRFDARPCGCRLGAALPGDPVSSYADKLEERGWLTGSRLRAMQHAQLEELARTVESMRTGPRPGASPGRPHA